MPATSASILGVHMLPRTSLWIGLAVVCAANLWACARDDETAPLACLRGQSISCAGPGSCRGYQVCAQDGTSYGPCQCEDRDASANAGDSNAGDGRGGSGTPTNLCSL